MSSNLQRLQEIQSLPELFLYTVSRFPERTAYATKVNGQYVTATWATAAEHVRQVLGGLIELGLQPGERLAILANNRFEWMQTDMAAQFLGLQVVPVYPNLPAAQVRTVLADSEAVAVVLSDLEQLEKVRAIRKDLPKMRLVVRMDDTGDESDGPLFTDMRETGAKWCLQHPGEADRMANAHEKDEIFTLIYTSGTTGEQKGVMLSHRNLLSNLFATLERFAVSEQDVFLSHLPLSHIFERMAGYYFPITTGSAVYYAQSILTVGEDLPDARPTILASVPRLFEKIQGRILENVDKGPKVKRGIFKWAMRVGVKAARLSLQGLDMGFLLRKQYKLADKLVFGKIREKTGGRMRFAISGGAPLRADLGEFFLSVGLQIFEGYGLTETSPVLSANSPGKVRFGSVGIPFPGVEIKIASDGEIIARGENVMAGYFNRPEATAEMLRDGWIYTGDVGHFDADGFLVITDRKKNLIVTSGGKNIAPQPIENTLGQSAYIDQVMLVGERRNYVSALIVPNFELLRDELGMRAGDPAPTTQEIIEHPEVYAIVDREIQRLSEGLANYERVRRFSLLGVEFTIESGELTPSLKIKRGFILEKYGDVIEGMYLTSDNKDRNDGK
jgi:long-chain acyl-CoA synthetase